MELTRNGTYSVIKHDDSITTSQKERSLRIEEYQMWRRGYREKHIKWTHFLWIGVSISCHNTRRFFFNFAYLGFNNNV